MPEYDVYKGCVVARAGTPRQTLVCVPAFADSYESWVPLVEALSEHCQIAIIELPGLGNPRAMSTEASVTGLSTLVADVVRHYWRTPVTLVGHSLGAALAARAAQELGRRCRGLVSIEGNLTVDDGYFTGQAADHSEPSAFHRSLLGQIEGLGARGTVPASFVDAWRRSDAPSMWALARDAGRLAVDGRLEADFATSACPRLYLWSQASTPSSTQALLRERQIPNHRLSIGHHWPWQVAPALVGGVLLGFAACASQHMRLDILQHSVE